MEDFTLIFTMIIVFTIGLIVTYWSYTGFEKPLSFIFNVFNLNKRKKINAAQETIASDFIKKMEKVSFWYEIIKERGNGQLMYEKSMGIKVDNYEYWANAHKEEYILKYNGTQV